MPPIGKEPLALLISKAMLIFKWHSFFIYLKSGRVFSNIGTQGGSIMTRISHRTTGNVSGDEAARRIARVLAGPEILIEKGHGPSYWFVAKTDGRLMIRQDLLSEVKRLPFVRMGSDLSPRFLRKNEVILSCCISAKSVPEAALVRLEVLIGEHGVLGIGNQSDEAINHLPGPI